MCSAIDVICNFPLEMWNEIFSHLESKDMGKSAQVCHLWSQVIPELHIWKSAPEHSCNMSCWKRLSRDIVIFEPSFSYKIHKFLKRKCSLWPATGSTIEQTHLLVWIPENLSRNHFQDLLKEASPMDQRWLLSSSAIGSELEEENKPFGKSRWLLMTKEFLPGSEVMNYERQIELIQKINQASGMRYRPPTALEATVCLVMEYIRSGELFYGQWKYTRCLDERDGIHLVAGSTPQFQVCSSVFTRAGLELIGMAGVMELAEDFMDVQ